MLIHTDEVVVSAFWNSATQTVFRWPITTQLGIPKSSKIVTTDLDIDLFENNSHMDLDQGNLLGCENTTGIFSLAESFVHRLPKMILVLSRFWF